MFKRRTETKKWTEMYEKKLNGDYIVEKSNISLPKINQKIPQSTIDSGFSVIKPPSLSPLRQPKHAEWKSFWGTQSLCSYCHRPCVSDCSICKMCNSVTHDLCIASYQNGRTLSGYLTKNNHICLNCVEFIDGDIEHFVQMKKLDKEYRTKLASATTIARRAVIFLERRRLRRKVRAIILIQSVFRRQMAKLKFESWKRSKLRVLLVELTSLPQKIVENGLVVLCAMDTFTSTQLIRIDKRGDACIRESFLVPGVTAQMALFLTLAIRDESVTSLQYIMVAQGQLSLRDITGYLEKKHVTVNFLDRIKLMPIEISGAQKHSLVLHPQHQSISRTIINKSDPEHTCQLRYIPQNPISEMCQVVYAPPLDVLRKSADIIVVKKGKRRHATAATTATSGSAANNNGNNSNNNNSNSNLAAIPTQSINSYRNYKYWMCIYRCRIYLYQYYGDAEPRFIGDLSDAFAETLHDKAGHTSYIVSVTHADQRQWLFEFTSKQFAAKLVLTINESRLAKGIGTTSKYIKSSDLNQPELPTGHQHIIIY